MGLSAGYGTTRSEFQTWMVHVLELDIERDISFQDGPTFADFLAIEEKLDYLLRSAWGRWARCQTGAGCR
jgi:hypothetical protein